MRTQPSDQSPLQKYILDTDAQKTKKQLSKFFLLI